MGRIRLIVPAVLLGGECPMKWEHLGHIFCLLCMILQIPRSLSCQFCFQTSYPKFYLSVPKTLNHHFIFKGICCNFSLGWWHDPTVIGYFTDIPKYSPNASSILSSSNKILVYKECSLGIVFSLMEVLHNLPNKTCFGWNPRCFSLLLKPTYSVLNRSEALLFKLSHWLIFPFHPLGECRRMKLQNPQVRRVLTGMWECQLNVLDS